MEWDESIRAYPFENTKWYITYILFVCTQVYPLQTTSVEVQTRGMTYRVVVMVDLGGKVANLVIGVFGAFSPTNLTKGKRLHAADTA